LTANPNSLDRISADMKTVYYVGRGKKLSPGEPKRTQHLEDQTAFLKSYQTGNPVAVLVKLKSGFVSYLGDYKVVSVRRVPYQTDRNFYQIKLISLKN
jgi:hypothetical protein